MHGNEADILKNKDLDNIKAKEKRHKIRPDEDESHHGRQTCDHRKIFPLVIFSLFPSLFLSNPSIFLLFEGRKIKERKEERREKKRKRREEELFCGVSLDLNLKIFEITRLRF